MNAADLLTIIGAVTISVTGVITAIASAIVMVRTNAIQKTTQDTHTVMNSTADSNKRLLESYRTLIQDKGLTIPPDQSVLP